MNTLTTNIKIARLLRNTFMLFLIFVRMYSYGQIVVTNDCGNISSPTTIDLTKHVIDSHPAGTTLTWHTGTPATSSNKYTGDPTKASTSSTGIDYYAAYEDTTPGTPCYSPTSTAIRAVSVSCTGIPVSNVCPTTFVDLTSHVTGTPPAGSTLVWIKGIPLNIANQVSNPSQVAISGDYYATFYDATNNCFSPAGTPITVTINSCGTISLANVCPLSSVDLTSHASPTISANGAPLKWFTSNTPSTANMVADPTAVKTSGTYYPAYYDATNNCFSPSGAGVVVAITTCEVLNPDFNVGQPNIPMAGNVSTNDNNVPAGTTYWTPISVPGNPSSCVPVMSSNGSYTFTCSTPGDYNFNVPVCESVVSVNCPTVPLKITVSDPSTPSNNSPIVNPDIVSTQVGVPVTVKALANDVSGNPATPLDPASVSVVTQPKHGTASVDPVTGNITYTPTAGYVGSDTLTYKVCDTATPPKCGTAQEIFTVLPTTAPNTTVAVDDYNVTTINTSVMGNVSTNDSDPQGNTQTVTAGTFPTTAGSLVLSSNGSYTFTPASGFTGSVDIPYTTCDNGTPQACAKATLHINVTPAACLTPVLTVENVTCSGTGTSYTVTFSSNGTVTTNNGMVSGNTVTVSSGNATLTSTSSCGEVTAMVVTAPSCPVPTTCMQVPSLSVGNALCTGTGTYTVSFSASNGTVTSSAGTVSGNTVINIPVGTNAVLTIIPTSTACNVQSVTVFSPSSCMTPSCNDGSVGISYSTACNNDGTYNINYTTSVGGTNVTTNANNSFVNLTGSVTLTITKPGCSPQNVVVTAPMCSICQTPTSLSVSPSSICSGGSTTLSATCSTGTLTWFTDSGLTGTALASNVVNPTTTTTYYASCVTGSCKSTASSVAVTVNPVVSLTSSNFTNTNPTSCNGTEGTIKICNLTSGVNYTVAYNKNNAAQMPLNLTADGAGCITLTGLIAGTYDNFNVTNTSTTCSSGVVTGVSMALSSPPSATITLGTTQNPSSCGAIDGVIQISGLTVGIQYTLNYEKNGLAQTSIPFTPVASTYSFSNLTAANYTNITVTNAGCISNPLAKSLADPSTANISLSAYTDPTACSGYNGTFTVSGLSQNTSYTLNYAKDGIAQTPITFSSVSTSYTVSGLTKGSYTNISVNNAGCISNSISVILSDPAAAVIALGVSNNPNACAGTDGSITITGLAPGTTYTIKYMKNGIWQTPISYAATGSSYTLTGLLVGAYTNLTVSNGGCVSNALSQTLSDPGATTIALGTLTNPSACGANNGSIIITGLSQGLAYKLNYVKDGVQQTPISFTASTTSYTLLGLLAANYTGISVTQGTCTSNNLNAMLSNPGGAIIDVIAMDAQSCLPGNDGSILITGLSQGLNYTLNYMKNGVVQTPIVVNAATTSYIIAGLTAANYTNITATQGSCVSNSVNAIIGGPTQIVVPALSSTTLNTVCSVGTANLNGIIVNNQPAGTTLEWHTSTPVAASNKVADPTVAVGGTYYAVFYNGTTKCYGATIPVTVIRVPCANPDNSIVTPGTPKIIQVLANDKNPDGTPAELTKITPPSVTTAPNKGSLKVNSDGTITYTPNANASGTDTFIYQICDKANPTVCDTALVTVNINCNKPVLTIENILCTGTGSYSVTFSSDGIVTSDVGTVSNTTVINIPTGLNVRLTSTSSCGVTSILDVNTPTCPLSATCTNPVSLSVGQAICTGNGTYVVSYSISNGTLTVSSGTINQTSVSGTTISGTISVSSLTNITITGNAVIGSSCTSQVITVIAPVNCQVPSCNDGDTGISYSTVCNSNGTYNINYTAVSGATVISSAGSFVNLTGSVTLTITENGCTPKTIVISAPSCVVNNDVKLQVKVFLQGAFFSPSGATDIYMRDDLRSLGVIPTAEPFTAMGNSRFTKVSDTGGQTIGTAVLNVTGVNAIVDWVFVELRDAANPATVLKTRAALVQRDGDVVEANDGITPVTFTGASGTSYYVSIKHRNHLGAMTATPIMMATTGTVVDFTNMNATQLWDKGLVLADNSLGSYNGSEQVTLGNGKMGLWAGNAINTDNKVKYSGTMPDPAIILSQVIAYPGNTAQNYNYDFVTPVYMTGDINMDGKVKYQGTSTDTAFILFNIINKYPNNNTNKLYNFDFMVEQIP